VINEECGSILSHLVFHRALIDDEGDIKRDRLESYVKMVEEMQQGVHLISDDPLERSISLAFELVIQNRLNPWEIDLIEFSKMYLSKVRKAEDINLIVAGKLILMAWEIFRLQTEDLLGRVDEPERVESFFDEWDMDSIEMISDIHEHAPAISIMSGELELKEAVRRPSSSRRVSLVELLDAFEEAKKEADVREEISKYLEKYRIKEFDDKAHKDTLEQDIAVTWNRIMALGQGRIPFPDLCKDDKGDMVAVFISILFLANMEKIAIKQSRPPNGEIIVKILTHMDEAEIDERDIAEDISSAGGADFDETTVVK